MRHEISAWLFELRRRISFGPVEMVAFALLVGMALASAADYALAVRHSNRLESAVYAGLSQVRAEASDPDLDTIKQATLEYLGLAPNSLPQGTKVSAIETCSCQRGIIETMEGMCPAKCEGAETVERKYVRVTFSQSHDWLLADSLMGKPQSLTVSRAIRIH